MGSLLKRNRRDDRRLWTDNAANQWTNKTGNRISYRGDQQRKGYAKEAAVAVRDWTFCNTPFNVIYSYMKYTNAPSYKTAISWGCKQVDEFADDVNEITKVFAISREEWMAL